MRGYYLNSRTNEDCGGCRGGVGSGEEDYEVEIGNQCHCSIEMMALMAHYDEIMEYLKLEDSPLAKMILRSLDNVKKKDKKNEHES
jgi:hypothetical protein